MTAKDLIDLLKKLPPDTRIFVKGYEGGLEDANWNNHIENVALDFHFGSQYNGPHEVLDTEYDKKKAKDRNLTIVQGICL